MLDVRSTAIPHPTRPAVTWYFAVYSGNVEFWSLCPISAAFGAISLATGAEPQ